MTKKAAGLLVLILLLAASPFALAAAPPAQAAVPPAQAAAEKKAGDKPALPITIEADELYFSDKTGEMFAQGNVVISQDKTQIFADLMRGNNKQSEIWVDGKLRYKDPVTDISGMKLTYNYGSKVGALRDLSGRCDDLFVKGGSADIQDGKYTLHSASVTTCPSKKGVPDYRITARKVEIWPGDKMIAYDARIWIKNTVIYSVAKYRKSLVSEDEDAGLPGFGFQGQDGFWLSQRFSYIMSDKVTAYTDLVYYTKIGFRPAFGVVDKEKDYVMSVVTGRFRDAKNNFIWKEPEFSYYHTPRRLGKLPVTYTLNVIAGKWRDNIKSSWHQEANIKFIRDPIYFDARKSLLLNLEGSLGQVRESFDNSDQSVFRFRSRLTKEFSPAVKVWTGFNYTNQQKFLFEYNSPEVPREGIAGISWKINNRTTLSFHTSYDLGKNRVHEQYYTVKQNFHCWDTEVTYRSVRKELFWTFTVAKW